jgi:hypothetical protein
LTTGARAQAGQIRDILLDLDVDVAPMTTVHAVIAALGLVIQSLHNAI